MHVEARSEADGRRRLSRRGARLAAFATFGRDSDEPVVWLLPRQAMPGKQDVNRAAENQRSKVRPKLQTVRA